MRKAPGRSGAAGAASPDGAKRLPEHDRADKAEKRHIGQGDDEIELADDAKGAEGKHP
jgi:hypothetical protein